MDKLYMYLSGGRTCISSKMPWWNSKTNNYAHAKGSKVLSTDNSAAFKYLVTGDERSVIILGNTGMRLDSESIQKSHYFTKFLDIGDAYRKGLEDGQRKVFKFTSNFKRRR